MSLIVNDVFGEIGFVRHIFANLASSVVPSFRWAFHRHDGVHPACIRAGIKLRSVDDRAADCPAGTYRRIQ